MLKREHREFLKSEHGRKWFIEKTLEVVSKDKNWQNFHTPYDLCEKMISKTNVEDKSILVLFNIEFLEVLIHKFGVLSKNILFLTDCKIESEMAAKIYKVTKIIVNNIDDIQEVCKGMKTFDLCFSNPPYNGRTHINIISELYKICNEMVVVQPENWALDTKNINKSWYNFKEQIYDHVKSIEIFKANRLFDIATYSKIGITHIDKKHEGNIEINYYGDIFLAQTFEEITKFGSKWSVLKKEFIDKISQYLDIDPNNKLINYIINDYNESDQNLCQIALNIGTPTYDELNENRDFYTLVTKNPLNCIGCRKIGMHTFKFYSFNECVNFVNFLSNKFTRFCLSIYKIDNNVGKNELQLIPWFDFKEEWNDQKLYDYFQISTEIQSYIESFLPYFHELKGINHDL